MTTRFPKSKNVLPRTVIIEGQKYPTSMTYIAVDGTVTYRIGGLGDGMDAQMKNGRIFLDGGEWGINDSHLYRIEAMDQAQAA